MLISDEKLSRLLKEYQLVSDDDLKIAQTLADSNKISLYDAVLQKDFIKSEHLGRLVAEGMDLKFISLSQSPITDDILQIIPEVVAKKQKIIAFKKDKEGLHIALSDPTNIQTKDFIEKKVGIPVVVYLATERDINNTLSLYIKDVKNEFDDIINKNIKQAASGAKVEPPIITIVETIMSHAYQNRASDIHIEPLKERTLVRFRIDGILHDIVDLPSDLHSRIVTRIKVMSKLRTDEHQAPQDGKLQFKTEDENLDIRVSIVPSTDGEKIVMRLLSEKSRQFSLADLGLGPNDLEKVQEAYKKPYGMILSTGPTGSGKTTTMYGILKQLNKRSVNIMTIEDPVEYDIEGVTQIQTNIKTKLTFASGLRSIVRQDPDIILVGEIRDEETADIATNSAMTGHLVLSTLHTNDSATAVPRLLDMKVEPFLVGSTVNVVIAQRLLRKIHSGCRISNDEKIDNLSKSIPHKLLQKYFGNNDLVRTYKGKGCAVDHKTGYVGRVGIFEVMIIDDKIREAIVARKDATYIRNLSIAAGMTTMLEDGLQKVKQGLTTIEEVLRGTKS